MNNTLAYFGVLSVNNNNVVVTPDDSQNCFKNNRIPGAKRSSLFWFSVSDE
jgi:hypothetical protein